MEIAITNKYDIKDLTRDQVINLVELLERDKWREAHPEPDHCDHEHYHVDGDIIKGYEWDLGDDW
jgi:hypothetical protein